MLVTTLAPLLLLAAQTPQPAASLPSRSIAQGQAAILAIAIDPAGAVIYTAAETGVVSAWNGKQKWELLWTADGPKLPPNAISAGEDFLWIANGLDQLWRVKTDSGKVSSSLNPPVPVVRGKCVASDRKDRWVWFGTDDGLLQRIVPGSNDGWLDRSVKNEGVTALALDGEGELLAVGGRDHTIRFVDASTGQIDDKKLFKGHEAPISALAFVSKSVTLASSAEDKVIRVWSVPTGESRFELRGHEATVRFMAVDAKSMRLASADEQGSIRVWNLDDHTTIATLKSPATGPVAGVAFVEKGKTLVVTTDKCLTLWDLSKL